MKDTADGVPGAVFRVLAVVAVTAEVPTVAVTCVASFSLLLGAKVAVATPFEPVLLEAVRVYDPDAYPVVPVSPHVTGRPDSTPPGQCVPVVHVTVAVIVRAEDPATKVVLAKSVTAIAVVGSITCTENEGPA